MKADPQAQRQLLEVQRIDTELDRNAHRAAHAPAKEQVASATAAVAELDTQRIRSTTVVTDLTRALTRAEGDVASVRARAERDQALLASGNVSSSKQLSDLEHEVASLKRRQADLEDVELGVMEELEQAEATAQRVQQELADAQATLAAAEAALAESTAALAAERANLQAQREGAVAGVGSEELLGAYQRLRTGGMPVAAGLLRYGRCEACQMELSRVDLDAARGAAADEVLRCPECRAIMVRTEESGL